MTAQRTLTGVVGSIMGLALITVGAGTATAATQWSDTQQVAISEAGIYGPILLGTDDDPWH